MQTTHEGIAHGNGPPPPSAGQPPPAPPQTLRHSRSELRGFGVRVAPSGRKRFFLHVQHEGTRVWRDCGDAADRSAPVLSVILGQAEIYGYRPEDSNPCRGIRRYRRRGRERFLGPEELRRFGAALDCYATRRPLAAAAVRLILLTGCRKSEILNLEWVFYREGKLFLPDSKTGLRTIWLSAPARAVLDALPRTGRQVFPGARARRAFRISERRACRVLGQHRSTQRYVPRGRDDEEYLVADMIELARAAATATVGSRPCCGGRRLVRSAGSC